MNKEDWKKMKPGQLLQWNNYDSISPQPDAFFVAYTKGRVWIFDGDELVDFECSDVDASQKPGKRVKLATFARSDDYNFLIYRFDDQWHCRAGCRRFDAPTLKELQARCLEYWDDTHNTHLDTYTLGTINLKANSDDALRVMLNRETRKKIKRAIGKLS